METFIVAFVFVLGVTVGVIAQKLYLPLMGVIEVKETDDKRVFNMIWMMPEDEVVTHRYVSLKVSHK